MPYRQNSEYGHTLIEALVVVSLVAVLAGVAGPNFSSVIKSSRMTGHYNSLTASVTLARSEAIKRASNVSVCAMNTDETCGEDWNQGWLVFSDNGETPGSIDDGEEVIKRVNPDDPTLNLTNSARLTPGVANPVGRPFISFGPRGASNWRGAGFFLFCDDRGVAAARVANITLSGDVRKGRRDASEQLINAFGDSTQCPS